MTLLALAVAAVALVVALFSAHRMGCMREELDDIHERLDRSEFPV